MFWQLRPLGPKTHVAPSPTPSHVCETKPDFDVQLLIDSVDITLLQKHYRLLMQIVAENFAAKYSQLFSIFA